MESVKDFFLSSDIFGWLIVGLMVIIGFRLILKTGALLVKVAILAALGFILFRFFPGVVQPIIDLIPMSSPSE